MWKSTNVFIDQMRRLYNVWDIRLMVLLSLLMQVLLQLLGNRRKFSGSIALRIIVWCCYVSVDSIAIMALGTISTKLGGIHDLSHLDGETKLNALWAPCLLLQLGGPDSITAYSVEDNQLWLRHFVVLVTQTSVAGYVCFMAWAADCLPYLSLLLLVAGVIKYGERVWVLWQVSFDKLRNSQYLGMYNKEKIELIGGDQLTRGYLLFRFFKRVFLSQKVFTHDRDISKNLFTMMSSQEAFKIIEIELGFLYDLLYTKAKAMYTYWGLGRRLMTSTTSCIVLAVFIWFVNKTTTPHYPKVDVVVTLVLLAANVSSEICWIIMVLFSDWGQVVWFVKHESSSCCSRFRKLCKQPQRTNSAGQLSFFSLFFSNVYPSRLLKLLHLDEKLGPYYYTQHRDITDYVKDQIFMIKEIPETRSHKELLQYMWEGDAALPVCSKWIERHDLDEIIIIWHIATELCNYYDDTLRSDDDDIMKARKATMLLSRYMFYILVRYPLMLQTVDVNIKLNGVKQEAVSFSRRVGVDMSGELTKSDAKKLMKIGDITGFNKPLVQVGDVLPPIFIIGCKFAGELMIGRGEKRSNVWRLILNSWLVHLYYAAYNCREEYHTQQLRRGRELLTHVWMLMLHLGLTDHFTLQKRDILGASLNPHSWPSSVIFGS